MRKSSACCQHSSLSGITMSRSELGVPGDQPIPRIGAMLRKAATKVVRLGVTEDRGELTTKTE